MITYHTDLTKELTEIIKEAAKRKTPLLVAIDGRCASGKTTLSAQLKECLSCEVIHMDHFFLKPGQRTARRLQTPGENVDHERFLQEVLLPLYRGKQVVYRPYECKTATWGEEICVKQSPIYLVEGAYSCHALLRNYYDLRIFLDIDSKEQMQRIVRRNGEAADLFRDKWIPLEEAYFSTLNLTEVFDYQFKTERGTS